MSEPKKRGRPAAAKTQEQAENSRVELEQSRDDKAHSAGRPPRVRMVAGQKLNFDRYTTDKDYHYRAFTDGPGRLEQAEAAWWEYVKDEDGNRVTRPAGPFTHYLMRIHNKYYQEDQELKQKNIVDTLKKQNKLERTEYVPEGHHHALQKDDDYDPLA